VGQQKIASTAQACPSKRCAPFQKGHPLSHLSGKVGHVVDTGGNLPPASLTPAANLPPVSLTPVANLPPVSTAQGKLMAKFAAGVV